MSCDHSHNKTVQCDTCYGKMSLGVTGWMLHRWEIELKQVLPRYRKQNRVEESVRQ